MILARSSLEKGDGELEKNVSDKDLHVLIGRHNIGGLLHPQQDNNHSNTGEISER